MNQAQRNQRLNTELTGKVRFSGYLDKLPSNEKWTKKSSKWKTRYMVLAENFVYYDDEDAYKNKKKPNGVICLDYANIEQNVEDPTILFLRTSSTTYKLLVMRCSSLAEAEVWLREIKKVLRGQEGTHDSVDVESLTKELYELAQEENNAAT